MWPGIPWEVKSDVFCRMNVNQIVTPWLTFPLCAVVVSLVGCFVFVVSPCSPD